MFWVTLCVLVQNFSIRGSSVPLGGSEMKHAPCRGETPRSQAVQQSNGRAWFAPTCARALGSWLLSNRPAPDHTRLSVRVLSAPHVQTRLVFEVPSRGLMGFGAEIRQETHGSAVVNSTFV